MECNVIKDLIPLYIDECCSEESAKSVEEHIEECASCKKLFQDMKAPSNATPLPAAPIVMSKLNDWKASAMQSVLLFVSFAIITVGVALEAGTPLGFSNGYWAICLVVPATGFLLSLANWYFVRLYKSSKSFSNCSLLATLGITLCAYIWVGFHYKTNFELLLGGSFTDSFRELFAEYSFIEIAEMIISLITLVSALYFTGIVLTVIFCILSKVLSNRYAKMLGKE